MSIHKLSAAEVAEMKERYVDGESITRLADIYGVTYSTAYEHCRKVRHERKVPDEPHPTGVWPVKEDPEVEAVRIRKANRAYLRDLHLEALRWIKANRLEAAE